MRSICFIVGLVAASVVVLGPPVSAAVGLLIAAPCLAIAFTGHYPGRRHE